MSTDSIPQQGELELPFPEMVRDVPLLPARMINEFCYCPRLAYLEWVQGEWDDSADTVEGRYVHRKVDKGSGTLPEADQTEADHRRVAFRRGRRVMRRCSPSTFAPATVDRQWIQSMPCSRTLTDCWHAHGRLPCQRSGSTLTSGSVTSRATAALPWPWI